MGVLSLVFSGRRWTRRAAVLVATLLIAVLVAGCGAGGAGSSGEQGDNSAGGNGSGSGGTSGTVTLKVGATAVPHAEILRDVAAPALEEQGIKLEVMEFSDYTKLNPALVDGELDANYFQHIPYLDQFNKDHGTNITPVAKVHIEPMGLYSDKITSLDQLRDGATVAIPNDPTNGGRALLLLQAAGLVKLKDGADYTATVRDIVENPKNLQIREVAAELIPRTLADVDLAAINTNYVLEAKEAGALKNPDPLFVEDADSPFANVLAVRPEDVKRPEIQALAEILVGPEVKQYIEEHYQGAVVPAQALIQ
ncbi:MetQ/NlpA family ABC transporter substrate-binding protein [Thermaerobacter subterraneus]|uniref:ABC-type metal ion transport system, periplasmic component/surface antigen n=1 Tax=Thermaerobacter subterraneus DSM 13965 TaxID=867903 RepID=K6Q052_9FIRM|nr:MetQ/NlpA family ABC transporter substrate-binding protein [Thermaerobacter subterraneus]EKP94259.1 ABC-type metal ion transport system, periplasmic component/surface antigen [Thermaerobacter subterraneus DSM 13965]